MKLQPHSCLFLSHFIVIDCTFSPQQAWHIVSFTFPVCALFTSQSSVAWKFNRCKSPSTPSCVTHPLRGDTAERLYWFRAWFIVQPLYFNVSSSFSSSSSFFRLYLLRWSSWIKLHQPHTVNHRGCVTVLSVSHTDACAPQSGLFSLPVVPIFA